MTLHTPILLTCLLVPQDVPRETSVVQDQLAVHALRSVTPQTWNYMLPAEAWQPLVSPIVLNGVEFAVRLDDPETLHLDTDADGSPEQRVLPHRPLIRLQGATGGTHLVRLRRSGDKWEWANGAVMSGRVEGSRLQIIDLNGDGRFDGFGEDAMVVGERRGASYLSRVASISDRLFHLSVSASGERATTRPYTGPTAHLNVTREFNSRGTLEYAVFSSGESSFELSDATEGRRVPAGSYRFIAGQVGKGRESARMIGGGMAPIVLATDQAHHLAWGGPLHARFRCAVRDGELTVFSNLRFTGVGGEEYFAFAPDARPPTIRVLDASTGKVVQYGQMGGCCGGGFSAYVARVPSSVSLEVQLVHKRSLFETIRGRVLPTRLAQNDKAPR